MHFHVLITTACDLRCKYCYSSSVDDIDSDFKFDIDYSLPQESDYDIALQQELPEVCQLISQRKISLSDFNYHKYTGCEIIP